MKLSAHVKVALAGALWFAFLAGASLPVAMSIRTALQPGRAVEVASFAKLSASFFGVPAALIGLVLANRIARSAAVTTSIGLGVYSSYARRYMQRSTLRSSLLSFSIQTFGASFSR